MKIGIDLRWIVFGETGGLTQWLHGTLGALFTRNDPHTYVLFHTVFNYHLFPTVPPNVVRRTLTTHRYYDELQDQMTFEGDFDLLLRYYPFGVLDRFPLERQIVCIPDCQHEVFPEFFNPVDLRNRRQAFNAYQTRGGAIATLTEFSRRELLADPWTTIEDVFLMQPGVPEGLGAAPVGELTDAERALVPTRPFFLYSANIWPHKNHRRIVKAFELFRKTHPDHELVFTGHPAGWDTLKSECRGLPVRHLGYVRPRLLAELQLKAVALAHLSLYEGFGIPLLEAFATGTPVVCGDRAALPEVAGDAAVTCEPTSIEAMAAALARVADDEPLRMWLRERGKRRLADFSWERGAEALASAFDRVAERARPTSIRVFTPPVVSIVTPSFNQGAFIRQTIDSVLTQDYPHIDYRVTDGGSTDDTVNVLKSYGDRVKWVSEKDRGQTHAINKGMAEARGDIRAYLNSDDLLRPGAVSRVVEHFRDNPTCDLVYGRDALIDAEGTFLGLYPTAEYSFDRLVECCCISQPATFWRTRLSKRIGPFDESLQLVMDYEYWLRADRAGGQIEHIPDVLAHTRMHRQTKTSGSGKPGAFHERFYRELFAVSIRHAGYISSRYVHTWLDTAIFNMHPWTRAYEEQIIRVVQLWYHNRYRCGLPRWRAAVSVANAERKYFIPYLRRQLSAVVNPRNWFRASPAPKLRLASDLWLGPELTLAHAGGPVRLAGVPSRDSVLRIFRGDAEVVAVELHADEPADVYVDVPGGPLRITFSDSEPLPDGRRVSFKLHGTTLFNERAVA